MFDFQNQVAIVTGATGSLGSAVTEAFYQSGASLILGDRHIDKLQDRFGTDPRVFLYTVDLMQPEQVENFISSGLAHFGRIDVLANTVGGFRMAKVANMTPDQWDLMLNLNLRTAFLLSKTVIPVMLEQQSGRIIHVSARGGLQGTARLAAYSASKSGLIRLVESLSAEVRDQGLTVNCVLPGTIDTPPNRESMPNADFDKWVPPAAIAEVILFLASEAARAVTGAALPVYGRS